MQNDERSTEETWQTPTEPTTGAPVQNTPDSGSINSTVDTSEETSIPPMLTPTSEDDEAELIRWQAQEYVEHDRNQQWYLIFGIVTVVLMVIAIFLMKSWTFAILIPVMATALIVYVRRPPAILDYSLTKKGLYVNERFYSYDTFRAFSLVTHKGRHTINLIPRKRFQLAQTISFPGEVGETLVDMLAARMPMQDAKPDIFDRITSRLRM